MRMRDIANMLGVSTMTVSRALRADAAVAPATRKAVLEAIERLGYVPDQLAGSLSSRRSGFVAVLVPSLNNSHFSETILALATELDDFGLQLLIGDTDYRREREEALVRAFLARKPEAMVLTSDGHTEATIRLLRRARTPVIEIWDLPSEPIQHMVGFSNREAMREMVRKLISIGYRRIAYLGESNDDDTRGAARRRGFVEAILESGLGPPRLSDLGRPPAAMSDGERGLDLVLSEHPDSELVVCVSDPLAFGVMSACHRRGLRVPEDIAVAGFGDFEISRIATPSLTTVVIDAKAMGSTIARLVESVRGATAPQKPMTVTVPATPALRESTRRTS